MNSENRPWLVVAIFVANDLLWLHPEVFGIHSIVIILFSIAIISDSFLLLGYRRLNERTIELLDEISRRIDENEL